MGVSLYIVFYNKLLRPNKNSLIALAIFFLTYLFVGSYIHMHINAQIEQNERKELEKFINNFYDKYQCERSELNQLVKAYLDASDNGISFGRNTSNFIPSWVFGGETLFFAFTLITTIGYGIFHFFCRKPCK